MKNKILVLNAILFLCFAVTLPSQAQNDDCRNLKNEIEKCLSDDNCAGAGALYDTYKELCSKDNEIELRIANCNLKNEKPNPTPNPSSKLTITVGSVSFDMVYVEEGPFTMGCTSEQGSDCESDEKPAHQVKLNGYYIGETEVTQSLWKAVMGSEPTYNGGWTSEYGRGDNYPAYRVSWEDVQSFIRKLNRKTGRTFRLPTEAEWEYAARGGNKSRGYKYSGSNAIGDVAWYDDNSGEKTHPVKTKKSNELGIYDMTGNVWEWCEDWYGDYVSASQTNPKGLSTGSLRVYRGGSWISGAGHCRVFFRNYYSASSRIHYLGFRLVLVQ